MGQTAQDEKDFNLAERVYLNGSGNFVIIFWIIPKLLKSLKICPYGFLNNGKFEFPNIVNGMKGWPFKPLGDPIFDPIPHAF